MKEGFVPISIEAYLDQYIEANPNEKRVEVESKIQEMIQFHNEG